MIQFLLVFFDWGLLVLRLILGVILIKHGFPKLRRFSETAESFRGMGFYPPKAWVLVAGLIEFVGGLFLTAGFLTQIVAVFIAVQFLVILVKLRWLKGESFGEWEYDLLICALAFFLITSGAGEYSADGFFGVLLY